MAFVPGGRFTAKQRRRFFDWIDEWENDPDAWIIEGDVRDFCLDVTESTIGDLARCVVAGACAPITLAPGTANSVEMLAKLVDGSDPAPWKLVWDAFARFPHVHVNVAEAIAVCEARGYRLPRIEQWLWVAWGGTQDRRYPWGAARFNYKRHNIGEEYNYDKRHHQERDGFFRQAPVGTYPAGAARWGHLDFGGNVGEWVLTNPPTEILGYERGVQYRSSCDATFSTEYEKFADEWTKPCGNSVDSRRAGRSGWMGFRCAAEPLPAQQDNPGAQPIVQPINPEGTSKLQ